MPPKKKIDQKRIRQQRRRRISEDDIGIVKKKKVNNASTSKNIPEKKRKIKKLPRKKIQQKQGSYTISQNPVPRHYVDEKPQKKAKESKPKKRKKGCFFYLLFACFLLLFAIALLLAGIYGYAKKTYEEIQSRDTDEIIEYFEEKLNSEAGKTIKNFLEESQFVDTASLEEKASEKADENKKETESFPSFNSPKNP